MWGNFSFKLFFSLCFNPPGSKLPAGENGTHKEPVFGVEQMSGYLLLYEY